MRRRNQPEAKPVNSCLQINTFLRLIETFRQLAASPTVKQQTIKIKWDAVPKPGVTLLQAEGKPAEMLTGLLLIVTAKQSENRRTTERSPAAEVPPVSLSSQVWTGDH